MNKKQLSLYLMRLLLPGLSINTHYSIIIVMSCTLMINKVTQTRCSSKYFFPTNAVYSLKSFISATSNANFYFFFHCLDSEKRTFRARHVKMINNNFFNVFNQDAGVFCGSCVHPSNTWTDLWFGITQDVTVKNLSCQDSPDYFTWSYFFNEFL